MRFVLCPVADERNQSPMLSSWKHLPEPDFSIASKLLAWFTLNGRSFPWREPNSPYHLLCVEIMLQRTRALQVAPVFEEFRRTFPFPERLLDAGKPAVDNIFERLGLRWRARTFWDLNVALVEKYGSEVPRDPVAISSLPGVGAYVAAAVRVFAFGEILTVVDSNVLRVFGRYYGLLFPDQARRSPRVLSWATQMAPTDPDECRRFNWALIDHGAVICTPSSPRQDRCPLAGNCTFEKR